MHAYFAEVGAQLPVANSGYDSEWQEKLRQRQAERRRNPSLTPKNSRF